MTNVFDKLRTQFRDLIPICITGNSIQPLRKLLDSLQAGDFERKAAMDQAFRDILLNDLIGDIPRIEDILTFSIEACRNDMVSITIPVVLLSDVFDAVTVSKCEQMFTFVENNVSVWREELFFATCKNNLLRMCNDLLRRLSRSQNTVFCGRILLFLAKFFPFSERSGLNVVSEFNLENLTEFEADNKDMDEALVDLENDQVKIDYNLYCKFWALQDYFRNPNQCYNKVQWKTFASHAESVLAAFNSFKLEDTSRGVATTDEDVEKMEIEESLAEGAHNFFAKFLTNPKLLALQLSDSNFRRSVLVQFLILFQYLTSTVKFKIEAHTLSSSQIDFIKETDIVVYRLLEETPPNGKKFAATVRHILQREELWNTWKNDGCKEFMRPELPNANGEHAKPPAAAKERPAKRPRRPLGDCLREADEQNKFYMGNPELTKLWNLSPDNLQACRGDDRNFLPSIESYIENPKDKQESSFEWRALRLLARQSPHFFTLMIPTAYKVSDYLDSVRQKIQKEKSDIKAETMELSAVVVHELDKEDTMGVTDQDDNELLKTDPLTPDDKISRKPSIASKEQIKELSMVIDKDWKRLAAKLDYGADLVLFFESEKASVVDACQAMLVNWFDEDEDANLENLAYILEGLQMMTAAKVTKRYFEEADKMDDISE